MRSSLTRKPLKVLVVGSTPDEGTEEYKDVSETKAFEDACRQIGFALAKSGMELVIGSYRQTSADRHVLEGYATPDVPGDRAFWFLRPSGAQPTDPPSLPPNVHPKSKVVHGPWPAGRVPQIQEADAVVLIRGSVNTRICGYVAPSLGTPVLAVASLDGAAAELWPSLEPYYLNLGPISDEIGALCRPWTAASAALVPRTLEALVQKRLFYKPPMWPLWACMLLVVLGLGAWVFLFQNLWFSDMQAFFAMIIVAGVLGTVLRTNMRLITDPTERFSWHMFILEVQAGVLLGFGLALAYLIGAITVTGEANPPTMQDGGGDFRRVAVIMTLLAFGAGFRIQRAASRLREWFGGFINRNEPTP